MNSKQSKKLKTMAELFYNMQVIKIKSVDQIYQELKIVHNAKAKTNPSTNPKAK